jgi:hypothetical protein
MAAVKEIVPADAGGVEARIERDQWDRPKIIPRSGGKPTGYVRVSTMAETLSDSFGLNRWLQGNIVKGITRRKDLYNSALVATTQAEIYELVDLCAEAGDEKQAARQGTSMHTLTALVDRGLPVPEHLPDNVRAMLDAYIDVVSSRFETLDTEGFVANDKIKVAGSFDRLLLDKITGLKYIGDLKTGQNLKYLALKTCMQVAMYAASPYYELDGQREPHGAERDRGVLIHLPWVDDAKDAECELRWLDLVTGRQAVAEAIRVREFRSMTPEQLLPRIK